MADNYLERKMEEHRSSQSSRKSFKLTPVGAKPGKLIVDFPVRNVYVTGGAKGIGRAIVKAFCEAGCKVAFCDKDAIAGRDTAQKHGAQFHPLDVTDYKSLEESIRKVAAGWGVIDILINNVGIGNFKPFLESKLEDFVGVLKVNLLPVWVASHTFASIINEESNVKAADVTRHIINIGSTRYLMSEPGTEGYSASKGAVSSLTHSLMMSLAPLNITVNCVSPGWIENYDYEGIREIDHKFHPSGRVGKPEDIAKMCLYLASPAANFINGQNFIIDGGVTKKMIYPED